MGALFTKIKFTLLKSERKDGFFDTSFAIFEEKKFSSLGRDSEYRVLFEK
jgi:hypothetical protein